MRSALLAVVALLAVPGAAEAASCGPRSADTWVENADVRVYYGSDTSSSVRICHDRTRRSFEVSAGSLGGYIEQIELAGDHVAFAISDEDERPAVRYRGSEVQVVNARTRRTTFEHAQIDTEILELAVVRSGSVAWLTRSDDGHRSLYVAKRRRRLLDSTQGPGLRALRVVRGRLTWQRDGERRSYPFR